MRPLRTGQGRRQERWASRAAGLYLHLQVLAAELHASSPMKSPTPVTPEERSRSHSERMEQQAYLTRLGSGAALPLTLVAQRAGAATADAGSIHDAQASIGFSALLMRDQRMSSLATQRPIGLESKVLSREATSFPGQAHVRGSIARGRSRVRWKRGSGWGRWDGRSKLGRAHGIRMQLMPQRTARRFQTHCETSCQHSCPQAE